MQLIASIARGIANMLPSVGSFQVPEDKEVLSLHDLLEPRLPTPAHIEPGMVFVSLDTRRAQVPFRITTVCGFLSENGAEAHVLGIDAEGRERRVKLGRLRDPKKYRYFGTEKGPVLTK